MSRDPKFPPAGLEPMPLASVALTDQYLNNHQRKLFRFKTVRDSVTVRSQAHCLRGILTKAFRLTFNILARQAVVQYCDTAHISLLINSLYI